MTETKAPTSRQAETKALLPCDIVMSGGVTSGIIYPGAVAKIAERYSFHCIGGTSVGAIAAAGTAAAEYGRRTGRNPGAFDYIAGLPAQLGSRAPDDRSRLFHLFTPERPIADGADRSSGPDTRGLLALVTPLFTGKGPLGKLAGLARFAVTQPTIRTVIAIAGGIGLLVMGWLFYSGHCLVGLIVLFPFLALVLCSALAALGALLAWKWLPAWRGNGYGICTGKLGPDFSPGTGGPTPFEGLTPWIHRVIQTAAGRSVDDPPLTFGELWTAPQPDGTPPPAQGLSASRSIELTMIASDISRNRTAQLPFLESPSELYVEEAMLRRYFPPAVVNWMCDPSRHGKYGDKVEKRDGFFRLPSPENLPLVLAARLSLSFPVLLSAVPLWTPDYAGKKTNRQIKLRRVWYSDGGLTSNFPVHFFDSPIPSRPTFCLNLVDFDGELTTAQAPPEEATHQGKEPERQEAVNDATREAGKAIARQSAPERKAAARPAAVSESDPRPGDDVWGLVSMASRNAMSPAPFTSFDEASGLGVIPFIATLINTARLWADNQMLIAPGTATASFTFYCVMTRAGSTSTCPPTRSPISAAGAAPPAC
jgi:predicted acylesterase/phospholipase RssA